MQVWANNSAWESMFQGSGEVKNEQKVKGHGRRGLKPLNNFSGLTQRARSLKLTCASGVGSLHSESQ